MIDWTYVHFRVFMRILAPHALLYTEMQTPGAIEHAPQRALAFDPMERPLALQLGGSDETALVACAVQGQRAGFSEINLNLGCPSDRVQAGRFGACLMKEPRWVANAIAAMKAAVAIPVTAKTRIGIDHEDSYAFFSDFVHALVAAGCDKVIVHARKAWLKGLSPKQNRTIPPLHYDYVYRIKQELPHVPIVLNGNVQTLDEVALHLEHVDGVMLGRLAYQNPYQIAVIHHALFPETPLITRSEAFTRYVAYVLSVKPEKQAYGRLIKPILNLTHGMPNAKTWRNQLVEIQRSGNLESMTEIAVGSPGVS